VQCVVGCRCCVLLTGLFFTRLLTGLVVEREEEGARSARRNEVVGHHDVYRYGPEDEMP
jgi:hypothetical protein